MSDMNEVIEVTSANYELNKLRIPREVKMTHIRKRGGIYCLYLDLPRWYRHPEEYGNMGEKYITMEKFDTAVFQIISDLEKETGIIVEVYA